MAQGRMLKKQISESKKLGSLKSDSARLLYTWLIPWLDIEGRYSADPEILKGHLFPKVKSMTPTKIQKLLHELAETDLIILYRHKGEQYFQFSKFGEMQTLHPDREAKSEIPPPNDNSCELMSNHDLSLLNKSKLNQINSNENIESFENEFENLWKAYHIDGKKNKAYAKTRFIALCKNGKLDDFKKGFEGYANFLEFKEKKENFNQRPKYFSTLCTDYEEYIQYFGHKVKADL